MKVFLGTMFAVFMYTCTAQAQNSASSNFNADTDAACGFSLSALPASFRLLDCAAHSATSAATPAASFHAPQPPDPAPHPRRHEVKGRNDSLQLGVGYEFVRFRSAPFNANLSGLHTSFTYYRNDWLGFEGSVVAGFGSSTLNNQSSRLLLYTGGPRVAWRTYGLQPWAHVLAGGLRVRPQAASGINGFALQLGGGVDYPFKQFLSFRIESDYLRSQLYSSGQNSLQFGAGFVFRF